MKNYICINFLDCFEMYNSAKQHPNVEVYYDFKPFYTFKIQMSNSKFEELKTHLMTLDFEFEQLNQPLIESGEEIIATNLKVLQKISDDKDIEFLKKYLVFSLVSNYVIQLWDITEEL